MFGSYVGSMGYLGGLMPFSSGSVVSGTLGDAVVFSGNVASGQIGWPHLANASVQSGQYASGSISRFAHASGSITSGLMASGFLANLGGGSPGGTNGQIQFNLSGAFAGAVGVVVNNGVSRITITDLSGLAFTLFDFLATNRNFTILKSDGASALFSTDGINNQIGVFGAPSVVQPTTTGTGATGYNANASANDVYAESTFTGGVGSAAYTVSDIVLALKQLGWLAN